jgi:hypothetical protein
LAGQVTALDARISQLEQQPGAANLAARLDALEKRVSQEQAKTAPQPPVDLRPLLARLDALEARSRDQASSAPVPSAPTVAGPSGNGVSPAVVRDLQDKFAADRRADSVRIDALVAKVDSLATQIPNSDLRGKLDEVNRALADLSAGEKKLSTETSQAVRLGRLDAAQIALSSGQPLGTIPDAPPALARFATKPPPTEAELRLAFGPAAQAALRVSQPDTEGKPFLDRVLARLQDFRLVTVREGDHVVIGNSAASILTFAQGLLAAGDLAGATKAVATLTGPPAEKMAPWLADAKSLLEARQSLASLVGND